MNDILKQRLAGALVIVVLTVIFWPMIFVGPEGDPLDRSPQVPSIPSLKQMQLDAPEPLQGVAAVRLPSNARVDELQTLPSNQAEDSDPGAEGSFAPAEGSFAPAEGSFAPAEGFSPAAEGSPAPAEGSGAPAATSPTPKKAQPTQAPKLDKDGIPIAWVLQVVSVGKQDKAEKLVQELLDMGHKGYFKAVRHGDGTLYRVYLGPKFDRGKVEKAKLVVDKKFRVNSIVTRYLP